MDYQGIEVPTSWEKLRIEGLRGVFMIIGAPDSGKSTFARYLYSRLSSTPHRVAFIDGDVGQATLGPPTTMTLVISQRENGHSPEGRIIYRVFVGSTSPRGHMLQTVIGLRKLVDRAYHLGATAIIVDTTGLIDPEQGGGILKLSKVDLLEPQVVFAIRRDRELDHILIPLRRSSRTSLVELSPVPSIQPRNFLLRRAHRVAAFRRYFDGASPLEIRWVDFAVVPSPSFSPGRLISFDNARGFSLGLGIVIDSNRDLRTISVLTPLRVLDGLDTIRIGNLWIDPQSFEERRYGEGV
ncbi:MAG: polynucleotide 5'-hydroxyl-kinase [Syntrophobacterales bacterium]|nr:polynucleotide 5'-hydroxyl-kinase [Syntrophobacterales bacterium]